MALNDVEVIDSHSHLFSYKFFQAFAEQAGDRLPAGDPIQALGEILGWQMPTPDPVELGRRWVEEMEKHGIEKQVLFTSRPGDEESTAAAIKAFPDKLIGYIMINPKEEGAPERARRAFSELGLKGVNIFPAMHLYHASDPEVYPIYEEAAKAGAAVFVHFGILKITIMDKIGLPNKLDMGYSNPIDLNKVARDFPGINFIIPHFGCGYFQEALFLGVQCPNVHLDTSSSNSWIKYMPYSLGLKDVFAKALETLGPRRILFGSDSNHFPQGWRRDIFDEQSQILGSLGLSKEDRALIMGGNIARILELK